MHARTIIHTLCGALAVFAAMGSATASAALPVGRYAIEPCVAGKPSPTTALVKAGGRTPMACVNGQFSSYREEAALVRILVPASAPSAVTIAGISGEFFASERQQYYEDGYTLAKSPYVEITRSSNPNAPFVFNTGDNGALGVRELSIYIDCRQGSTCELSESGYNSYTLKGLRLVMTDPVAPTVSFENTGLLSPGTKSGLQTLTFTTSDAESGVQFVDLETAGTKTRVATGGCDYQAVAACPLSRKVSVSVDTAKLPAGPSRSLAITMTDAAGNVVERFTPTFAVADQIAPAGGGTGTGGTGGTGTGGTGTGGTGGSTTNPGDTGSGTGTGGTAGNLPVTPGIPGGLPTAPTSLAAFPAGKEVVRYTRGYGKKVTVQGLVLRDRLPAAGATVDVAFTVDRKGAVPAKLATVVADPKGRYSYTLQPTASGKLTITPAGSTASRTIEIRVEAGVTLSVPARAGRRGRPVTFSGKVRIDPFPDDPPRVAIQVRSAYGWQDVAFLQSRADGTFRWSHAFRSAGAFRFRAKVLRQRELGAAPGVSPIRRLRIR